MSPRPLTTSLLHANFVGAFRFCHLIALPHGALRICSGHVTFAFRIGILLATGWTRSSGAAESPGAFLRGRGGGILGPLGTIFVFCFKVVLSCPELVSECPDMSFRQVGSVVCGGQSFLHRLCR